MSENNPFNELEKHRVKRTDILFLLLSWMGLPIITPNFIAYIHFGYPVADSILFVIHNQD